MAFLPPQIVHLQTVFLRTIEQHNLDTVMGFYSKCDSFTRFQLHRAANHKYASPVHCAAAHGRASTMRWLLCVFLDMGTINCCRADGQTPLMAAVNAGSLECVRVLLQYADPFVHDARDRTALCLACQQDKMDIMACILNVAVRNEPSFGAYVETKFEEAWRIHFGATKTGASFSQEFLELVKALRHICRSPSCKLPLLRKNIYARFRIMSESTYMCGCALVGVLYACLELLYDSADPDAVAVCHAAVSQFCETNWVERCFKLLIDHADARDRSQVITMTTMHLLVAVFASMPLHSILAVLNLPRHSSRQTVYGRISAKGIRLFFKSLATYPYFLGNAIYPSTTLKSKSGALWRLFQYDVEKQFKKLVTQFNIPESDLGSEHHTPVYTSFDCECDLSVIATQLAVVKKLWNNQVTDEESAWKPSFKDLARFDIATKAVDHGRSSSVPPRERDIGKPRRRGRSFCEFESLPSLSKNQPLLQQSGSWEKSGSSEAKVDALFVTKPFNQSLEYSSCYIEAITRIVRDMSLGTNPVYPRQRLNFFDLKDSDTSPVYLKTDFLKKRAGVLVRDLEKSVTTTSHNPPINVTKIEKLIRSKTSANERRPLYSVRFQVSFEKLVALRSEDGVKIRSPREVLTVPRDRVEGSFTIGQRQGSKMVLALLEEPGQNPRGIVVKVFPRDDVADVAVKRHIDYNALAHLVTADSGVLAYRLFLNDQQFWYIARPVCDWNLDELIDHHSRKGRNGPSAIWNPHSILRDCMEGLQFLHSRPTPIYHGNLKPSNVLVDAQGMGRLTDFGFGKFLTPSHELNSACIISKRSTGRVDYDTRCWKPLEYFTPKSQYGCSSDVQSLALLGYYMLSDGRGHPFIKENMQLNEIRLAISEGRYHLSRKVVSTDAMLLFRSMLSPLVLERPTPEEALDHVYFWNLERKAFFILVTACQPEFQLFLQDEPIMPCQLEVIQQLKGIDMTPWMQSVPPNDPVLDATSRDVRVCFDNTAFSFIAYAGIYLSKQGTENRLENVTDVLSKFSVVFSSIYTVLEECGWASRPSYQLTKKSRHR